MTTTHGSPYDRGRADSYYMRERVPHKWTNTGWLSPGRGVGRVELTDANEIAEYHKGYDDNERDGMHKEYFV